MDDKRLIEQSRAGDADAFGQLVHRYQEVAFRVAYMITGSAQDAEESTQDGFTRAYFALDRFRIDAPFRPWLLRIVANSARNRRDAASRRYALSIDESSDLAGADSDFSPEVRAIEQERRELLLRAINCLQPGDRDVIVYRYFLDLSEAEMAGILEVAPGTIKSRLSRALARARVTLQSNRHDDE